MGAGERRRWLKTSLAGLTAALTVIVACWQNPPYEPPGTHTTVGIDLQGMPKETWDSTLTLDLIVVHAQDTVVSLTYTGVSEIVDTLEVPIADSVWFHALVSNDFGTRIYSADTVCAVGADDFQQIVLDMVVVLTAPVFAVDVDSLTDTIPLGAVLRDTVAFALPPGVSARCTLLTGPPGMALQDSVLTWQPESTTTSMVRVAVLDDYGGGDTLEWEVSSIIDLDWGLVAYYPFNGDARDESGNGNDGVVSGAGLSTDRFGDPDRAYEFQDHNQCIMVDHSALLDFGESPFSVVCWFRTWSTAEMFVAGKYQDSEPESNWNIALNKPGTELRARAVLRWGSGSGFATVATSDLVVDGAWHCLALTRSDDAVSLYLDGVPQEIAVLPANVSVDNLGPLAIGGSGDHPPGQNMNGRIDGVRIYDRPLAAQEAGALFGEGGWPVGAANNPPFFTTTAADMTDSGTTGAEYRDTLRASDGDGDALALSFVDSVGGMALIDSVVVWTPTVGDTGTHTVVVAVRDSFGDGDTLTWFIDVSPHPDGPSLVAYFRMDGDAVDYSGYGNHGEVSGPTPADDRFGNTGKALYFDGIDDGILCPDSPTLRVDSALTVSAWVKVDERDTSTGWVEMLACRRGGYCIWIGEPGSLSLQMGAQWGQRVWYRDSLKTWLKPDTWYHVVATFAEQPDNPFAQEAEYSLYINGVAVPCTTTSPLYSLPSDSGALGLGCSPPLEDSGWSAGSWFHGTMDDVRIYSKVLGPTDVWSLYSEGGWQGPTQNTPPEFVSTNIPDTLYVDQPFIDTLRATDADGDFLLYQLATAPQGMSMHERVLSWVPALSDTGLHAIVAVVSDLVGHSDTLAAQVIVALESYDQWPFAQHIEVNTTAGGANVAEQTYQFPLLVRLHSSHDFSTWTSPDDGMDTRFATLDGRPLAYEIERWENGAGTSDSAEIWVLIDTVRAMRVDTIVMYWGRSVAGPVSSGSDVFTVSDGFGAVWHLNEAPDTGDAGHANATADLCLAEARGFVDVAAGTTDTSGAIDGADHFGDSANLWVGYHPLTNPQDDLSVSCWLRKTGPAPVQSAHIITNRWDTTHTGWGPYRLELNSTNDLSFVLSDGAADYVASGPTLQADRWYHVCATRQGPNVQVFVDGSDATGSADSAPMCLLGGNWGLRIGGEAPGNRQFTGFVDEVRIESVARSAAWIKLCYENQRPDGDRLVSWGTRTR